MNSNNIVVAGFSFVETLVSLVIFSLVFLGVAKGYLLLGSQQASIIQQDKMTDIMVELIQRSVRNRSVAYFTGPAFEQVQNFADPFDCVSSSQCSAQELRDHDLWWAQQALAQLTSEPLVIRPCPGAPRLCLAVGASFDFPLPVVME